MFTLCIAIIAIACLPLAFGVLLVAWPLIALALFIAGCGAIILYAGWLNFLVLLAMICVFAMMDNHEQENAK